MTGNVLPNVLKLVPRSAAETRAAVEAMSPADRAQVSPEWLARLALPEFQDHWSLGFSLVRVADGAAVGQCGFKGPPDVEGMVELAYGIEPEFRGRGYATDAARLLLAVAFESDRVRLVRAHTLEESNASARVLRKAGFRCVGQVVDPEDGQVWRWEQEREPA